MQEKERKFSFDHSLTDQNLPIPIQIFLWKQVSPFIRPKLGKLHEASCTFCQHAPPGHHELKEACKAFEKVLVQNIQFGLKPDLTEAIRSISRWRLIQASLPHVMHCISSVLYNRLKDGNIQILGAVESKLLYTLHWILLDAAEECADADYEKGIFQPSPFYYLFSIPTISLFVYLFAPVCQSLKESDFQNFRLENGLKLWQALWEFRHPETPCFTTHCKPKPKHFSGKNSNRKTLFGDVFVGRKPSQDDILSHESPPSTANLGAAFADQISSTSGSITVTATITKATVVLATPPTQLQTSVQSLVSPSGQTTVSGTVITSAATTTASSVSPAVVSPLVTTPGGGSVVGTITVTGGAGSVSSGDEDGGSWVSSPKDTVFPETIPEESSSTEEEHVVIFRLPSLHESDGFLRDPSIYTAETSLFQLAMKKNGTGKPHFKVEQVTAISASDTKQSRQPTLQKISSFLSTSTDKDSLDSSKQPSTEGGACGDSAGSRKNLIQPVQPADLCAATFMDVAVLRCLFITHWQEDGVYWALHYMYNRLRDISEENINQQQPRRRSNSLPIPKIEVSLYQSTDSKKYDSKDFIEVPELKDVSLLTESPYHNYQPPKDSPHKIRRATSEKSKKRMKMADLKAFVETKLLSKSEKALEKLGQEDPKFLGDQPVGSQHVINDYHRSLDTGDDNLTRPSSTMSYMFQPTNLVKGKSMPSLRYIGEFHWDRRRFTKLTGANVPMANPIITVTEHTPTPSPDYLRRQGSMDSQLDAISLPSNKPGWFDRKASLTRSQTDSNITYTGEDIPEAPGSFCYITRDGDIDIQVVLKAVHSAALRDATTCTLRVLEVILNLVELLMDLGVMKQCLRDEALTTYNTSSFTCHGHTTATAATTAASNVPTTSAGTAGGEGSGTGGVIPEEEEVKTATGSKGKDKGQPATVHNATSDKLNGKVLSPHRVIMNVIVRVLKHLGCPHGCTDGQRGPAAEFLRTQSQNILTKLHRASTKQFNSYLRDYVRYQPLSDVLDLFHAYLGFCIDPSSLLSPLNQKRGSSKTSADGMLLLSHHHHTNHHHHHRSSGTFVPTSSTHAGLGGASGGLGCGGGGGGSGGGNNTTGGLTGGIRGVEGQIIACVFKALVTRMVNGAKEIKAPENIPMYCEVRQLMTYVKEGHGSVFRRVAISALLDTAEKPSGKKDTNLQTTRVIRHMHHSEMEEPEPAPPTAAETNTYSNVDDRSVRKLLFKKRSTSSTCASLLETEGEETSKSQSPLTNLRKKHHILTPRHSEKTFSIVESMNSKAKRSKLGGIVNWFKSSDMTTSESTQESLETLTETASFIRQQYRQKQTGSKSKSGQVSHKLQKAKRRVEDRFNKLVLKKGKKKDGSLEESPGSYLSRRNSFDLGESSRESEFVVFKERKLVSTLPVFNGMLRLSFLLETCPPGSVPDANLLAASLDLPNSAVVARASLLLECAYFVHCCNKGQWPCWMKLSFPMFRPSGPLPNKAAASGIRRTHIMQRAAGKMFYQWAEAIGARLEEMTNDDKQLEGQINAMVLDDAKQKELMLNDEEEDFLDEASIATHGSSPCPLPLRLIACHLLLEITSFLRETYQTLPKSSRLLPPGVATGSGSSHPSTGTGGVPGTASGGKSGAAPWEKIYSREANRRWSMALSSMGHSQASAQSLQSIAGDRESGQTERKISFVLHEPDNESEGSGNTALTMQSEEGKRLPQPRPYLLRRGAGGVSAGGSFKRRSLKLRRGTKEGKEMENEWKLSDAVKRTDSIQSKRKVSSISDRSDTSEAGVASGEESPGVLSDDQPPESPSDSNETDEFTKHMPWLKVMVQVANSMYFFCNHQNFCHPYCYRRIMRGSSRLIKAVRKVYGEEFGVLEDTFNMDNDSKTRKGNKKEKGQNRKVSDQTSSQVSPIRRKDSVGRKDRIDKNVDTSQMSKLSCKDSSRDIAESEADKENRKKRSYEKPIEPPAVLRYIKTQVKTSFQSPLAVLLKGAVILSEEQFLEIMPVAWELLLESNQEVAACAASIFILAAVRAPSAVSELMQHQLSHADTHVRINSILRFQVLWKLRYQVWPRMEEGAHLLFKVPPPGIEFTLPSPKIGIESLDVVDSPWELLVKTKVEEVTINQERHRSLVTATKTRKKQQTELIKMALQAQDDKKREEREHFLITTIPITVQAAHEPSLYHTGEEHEEDDEQVDGQPRNAGHHLHSAHSLFPSCLCSAVIQIINLLDDAAVSADGNAVYEVAYQVIWCCLVEDSALFLRYILERLTRDKQDQMFKILRHLIRFIPKLPQQAAFALYNYIIGYVMFYVRSPHEEGQKLIGTALSLLWMVVHSVHGIMFKDLKQILRKEQCDASILLTANVPSAKKIIVHGPQEPDDGGIPSQFPVQEDTQFCQILRESLDFFGIDEIKHKEYFLVDHKTHQIRNPSSYVRDFYFFKRSQYPQLELTYMKPADAFSALQRQELGSKFVEIGKVLLTWAILKNVDMVVQRVVFLHEELMKLPSFPRRALEADLDLYRGGEIGKMLLGLDVLHKFMWVRLIARMFEAMAGNFAYSGDIHLFLNVLNGAVILHSEDSCILRYVMATYINAAFHFKNIFSTNGYLLIMPTLLKIYSNHQTNKLVTTTVEYAVKQFYLMNRKPFILQMFGSVSAMLDTDEEGTYGDAHKIQSSCLFNLLLSLETPSPDPLNIAELVKEEKPLKPIDFCYHDEYEMVTILDCISLCVMVVSYSSESMRGYQMLIILEAILPCYVQHIQLPSYNKEGKTEKEIINQLAVAIKTLVNNCEALAKSYNGPYRSSPEHKGSSSQRNYSSRGPYSPGFDDYDDEPAGGNTGPSVLGLGGIAGGFSGIGATIASAAKFHHHLGDHHSRGTAPSTAGGGGGLGSGGGLGGNIYEHEDSEVLRADYRRPRDVLLSLVGEFMCRATNRLQEFNRRNNQEGKLIELLDVRSHIRLADIAHSLLKVSPYDPESMGCRGLQHYMSYILPSTEWANDAMRPALVTMLRRLDKVFQKISKKPSIRRNTDWDAAAGLLKGIYDTMMRYPYIMHWQHVKGLINTCQTLVVSDSCNTEGVSSATAALMNQAPPPHFCSTVVRLIALQILNTQDMYTLEQVCGGSSTFPSQEKSENMIMNLVMPLCLRVGSGRKDVSQMRQSDISFALILVLHAMSPPNTKNAANTTTTMKTATEMRTGSLTFTGTRDTKTSTRINTSLYQVSFLALKVMAVCFEGELITDWSRIARAMRELGKRNEAASFLWDFLDFVVTHRTPLFILMQPFIFQKLAQPPISDFERNYHAKIRDKIRGIGLPHPKSRGALLMELAHEMKELKEELEDSSSEDSTDAAAAAAAAAATTATTTGKKDDSTTPSSGGGPSKTTIQLTSEVSRHHQRPSLIEFLTGGGGGGGKTAVVNEEKGGIGGGGGLNGGGGGHQQQKESSSSASFISTQANASISENNEVSQANNENNTTDRSQRSSASDEPPAPLQHVMHKSESTGSGNQQQRSHKLRFVSSVEFRHSSGETSTTPLSPGSPADDSSGETHPNKSRLQRIKPQSRKTFRLRKSRKNKMEVSSLTFDNDDITPCQPSPPIVTSPSLGSDPALSSPSTIRHHQHAAVTAVSPVIDPHRLRIATRNTKATDGGAGGSYDEDSSAISQTSSTSGYRESYPVMRLLDPPECSRKAPPSPSSPSSPLLNYPPLASPDLPSTASSNTTTNHRVCGGATCAHQSTAAFTTLGGSTGPLVMTTATGGVICCADDDDSSADSSVLFNENGGGNGSIVLRSDDDEEGDEGLRRRKGGMARDETTLI